MSDALVATGLIVDYGGHRAVDDVSFRAPSGRITGLIGPNGAGKTTTFNACTGLVRLTSGEIALDGQDITSLTPQARARAGLGRTFQRVQLCDALSVAENVAIGCEAGFAGSNPLRQLVSTRGERARTRERTEEALALCGITALRDRTAASLPTGQRRLVELARVLAGAHRCLLLDEPSSGLDTTATAAFGDILLSVVRERGVGILLVEHDMGLVMRVCDHLYVLDFGSLIFEGSTGSVRDSELVRSAYLGTEAL
jgi:ABC-type branched-subunit amino acid transport system ATPase component